MIKFIKRACGIIMLLVVTLIGFIAFGPRENVDFTNIARPATDIAVADVDNYLALREGVFDDILEGQEKQVIWAGDANIQTDIAIVYLHGFSASKQEIRPVPDIVAKQLGANLYYTRLAGHGRGGTSMGDIVVDDWLIDLAEAMNIGRALGKQVIVLSTSTGGTLALAGTTDAQIMKDVAGMVFVSPNFGVHSGAAFLANWPYFRTWGPLIAGETRTWEPSSDDQRRFWSTSYPTTSVVPMMRLIDFVSDVDLASVKTPALFYYSNVDQVVDAQKTDRVLAAWVGPKMRIKPVLSDRDDPMRHVVLGDILSPAQTDTGVDAILDWVNALSR